MDNVFATTELKLAAWLLYQDGAQIHEIRSHVKSSGTTRDGKASCNSKFYIDVEECVESLQSLLSRFHNGDAHVDVCEYERVRNNLMAAMRRSHDNARREAHNG